MDYNETKDEIIYSLQQLSIHFEKCFLVRNIHSRYAIYFCSKYDLTNKFKEVLKNNVDFIDTIEKILEVESDFIYSDLIDNSELIHNSKNIYFAERSADLFNWVKFNSEKLKIDVPIISFYSFKGGLGRTTTLLLTAILLAKKGKKILLIDFDFEAPGLASIFINASEKMKQDWQGVKGVLDFMCDYEANKSDINKLNLNDYFFICNDSKLVSKGGELYIVPAISFNLSNEQNYIQKLSKINFNINKNILILDELIISLKNRINPDYIFIDCRTGINDIGGLVFNHYADMLFLFFFGNAQNMFGLKSIIPILKKIKEKNINLDINLINSPAPLNENDFYDTKVFYLDNSYEIFCTYFYNENEDFPDKEDVNELHYPIDIRYSEIAVNLNSINRINQNLTNGNKNGYDSIINIIETIEFNKQAELINENIIIENYPLDENKVLLKAIEGIINSNANSDSEFNEPSNFKKIFYPKAEYKFLFDFNKFLIIGGKGTGKTALFSILKNNDYAISLAKFCNVENNNIESTIKFIIGFEKSKNITTDYILDFKDINSDNLRKFWMILAIKQIIENLPSNDVKNINIQNIDISDYTDIKNKSIDEDLSNYAVSEMLKKIDNVLKKQNRIFILTYDYLDKLTEINNISLRKKLISALVSFYYEYVNIFTNIKSKIFLRQDIFSNEVDITDKVKLNNYMQVLEWQYDDLLNLVWKRIIEKNSELPLFKNVEIENNKSLGYIPTLKEDNNKNLLVKLLGERMGGNNKAFPNNWIKYHIQDGKEEIHPRAILELFSKAAVYQLEDTTPIKDRIIRSRNIENAVKDVSINQAQEIKEEYYELKVILNELSNNVPNKKSPIFIDDLNKAILIIIEKYKLGSNENEYIKKLDDIGVLIPTKIMRDGKKGFDAYKVPDLYLYGLGFERKGPS